MSNTRQTILASRPAAMVLALSLAAGLSAPFVILPQVHAQTAATYTGPNGTTELSAAPVDQTTAVPPNIAVTFDDSGSMAWDYMGDTPPFNPSGVSWQTQTNRRGTVTSVGGPWYCAGVIDPAAKTGIGTHAMNGVYYNPNVPYTPPIRADGGSFPEAGTAGGTKPFSLANVENDGVTQWSVLNTTSNSPTNTGTTDFTPQTVTKNGNTTTKYWQCPYDSGHDYDLGSGGNRYSTTNPVTSGTSGGPYYYKYTGPTITTDKYGNPDAASLNNLYTASNWTAVAVPANKYQNWANWWAYYRTRNQMARTALSRVFGSASLATTTASGGYGNDMRVAWQNLYTYDQFTLQEGTVASVNKYGQPVAGTTGAIISALIDTDPSSCNGGNKPPVLGSESLLVPPVRDPPNCYRSDFFNWIFQVPALSGTPLRSALVRAGEFFRRGKDNTGVTGDLHDPYWQPPQRGVYNATTNPGNELYCRQNFSILITDGLWNGGQDGPPYSTLTLPDSGTPLPDGVTPPSPASAGATSIYAPVHDGGNSGYASLSDIAYHYWATNLRTDLYLGGTSASNSTDIVSPYLPDTYTGLFGSAGDVTGGYGGAKNIPVEEYFNPKNDPATWPHMADYMIGLGVNGKLNFSENTDCKSTDAVDLDACNLRKGVTNSVGSIGWPTPDGGGNGIAANIDDTWHAALAGRGQFFSAANPDQLVSQLTSVLSNIAERAAPATTGSTNASVLTTGALSFSTGHQADWSGIFRAVTLNSDGTVATAPVTWISGTNTLTWDAAADLDAAVPSKRNIYTDSYSTTGVFTPFAFTSANKGDLDTTETAGLLLPAIPTGSTTDTLGNRIDYLRGDKTHEADGTYRARKHLLGAIIHSQPVYVSYPASGYFDNWPSGSPEATAASSSTDSYGAFVADNASRAGTVYVGANDGMLHAFAAPAPTCTSPTACDYGDGGTERWAFVPRAVYPNLGNLTDASSFTFRATVDATPVTRDVFFSAPSATTTDDKWHTILVGGVGVGGRGVYALDITDPTNFSKSDVLWEFDADMKGLSSGCTAISGNAADPSGCRSSDLGFTISQPNIGRVKYKNEWVALVPNGYFPDCSKGDKPTDPSLPNTDPNSCSAIAGQAPTYANGHPYSALFVLDAQTGKMIAELKTPDLVPDGVYSFGLATPVMGDYNNDQIDDVAFAGDVEGNLWRFDLQGASPSDWTVTLVYKGISDSGGNQGLQPITTMPRLFPDPATNRFMVVFGTGKYLGADDNGTTQVQAVYGIRDPGPSAKSADAYSIANGDLVQQYLSESVEPATLPGSTPGSTVPNPLAGITVRCITGTSTGSCSSGASDPPNAVPAGKGGWYFNLETTSGGVQTDLGEQVVVSPGAIFASNTAVISTLMTGASGSDPCNPAVQGAVMFINAIDGGPGSGVSSLGGYPAVGARINNARTSGSLPVVSALGGGQVFIPGMTLTGSSKKTPIAGDLPVWRRRSWSEINQNQ